MAGTRQPSVDYLVQSVWLRNHVPLLLHAYMLPYLLLYVVWLAAWMSGSLGAAPELLLIGLAVIALLQGLTSLSCLWSVAVKSTLSTRAAASPQLAELVTVVPTANNGSTELVALHHQQRPDGSPLTWFRFQKAKYLWDWDKKRFHAVEYPVNSTFAEYGRWRGHETEQDVQYAEQMYGKNLLDLDVPDFVELFKERAAAPFFVFQVFCVGLWCLDEYWYYSIFTLVMLVMFECTLVYQQMRNMSEIRNMGNRPFRISVYRCRKWRVVSSDELVPGDLVSITRSDNVVPCDMLLVRGSCILDESMLTGESIPQMKEPIEGGEGDTVLEPDVNGRLHILFGGTRVVQHTTPDKTADTIRASDNGCVAYVLRTSFATSQGKLLRTIMYGVKRVTANTMESFCFILFLLIFALAAVWYLWTEGTKDPNRDRYKLFLECTLILTSVIPPELPIELSLAVNSSLISLVRLFVFCTEPFRIPSAGKVEICCFDKTGTLTSDNLIVEGVAGLDDRPGIVGMAHIPQSSVHVLATCHALAQLDDGLVGDPLEKVTLHAIEWNLTKGDSVVPRRGRTPGMKIFHRFHFSSALKRMSVVAGYTVPGTTDTHYIATVKGAPETLKPMFVNVPQDYDEVYLSMARRGARVLALGLQDLGCLSHQEVKDLTRSAVERQLEFAGFVVISCPLKSDSKAVIREILNASHQVTMITGDNPLTACHVAAQLRFTSKKKLTVILTETDNDWVWRTIDESITEPLVPTSWKEFCACYDICLTGDGITYLQQQQPHLLRTLLPVTRVFARVAPKQKELIITSLKEFGFTTLMCGDGTNDVGALKHAHVGVAILANAPERMPVRPRRELLSQAEPAAVDEAPFSAKDRVDQLAGKRKLGRRNERFRPDKPRDAKQERIQQLQTMLKQMEEEEGSKVVQLGDASIAAPFTSKLSSINSVCHIIKQGRCTLVTTLQMFKILALNALILAYSQSVLYLDGVKFSDGQATMQGILLAFSFLFISRSKPLKVLSQKRPLPNIFNLYTVLTVLLQFAVHFSCLVVLVSEAKALMPLVEGGFVDLDKEFEPNILNSTVYIVSMTLQVATFAINYCGHPFMESLWENRCLLYSILSSFSVVLLLALGLSPDLSAQFSVVEFPDEYRAMLVRVLLIDVALSYVVDRLLRLIFDRSPLRAELTR